MVGAELEKFISLLKVLPVSSVDGERGFNQMNLKLQFNPAPQLSSNFATK